MWNVSTLFFVNFLNPLENSTIIHSEKLNKKTIKVLLNEDRIEAFAHENNILHK